MQQSALVDRALCVAIDNGHRDHAWALMSSFTNTEYTNRTSNSQNASGHQICALYYCQTQKPHKISLTLLRITFAQHCIQTLPRYVLVWIRSDHLMSCFNRNTNCCSSTGECISLCKWVMMWSWICCSHVIISGGVSHLFSSTCSLGKHNTHCLQT